MQVLIRIVLLFFLFPALSLQAQKGSNMPDRTHSSYSGVLRKKATVGYRSPYFLELADENHLEIRSSEQIGRKKLDNYIGKAVEVIGNLVKIEGGPAPAGSEAASRFADGIVPSIEYLIVKNIRNK